MLANRDGAMWKAMEGTDRVLLAVLTNLPMVHAMWSFRTPVLLVYSTFAPLAPGWRNAIPGRMGDTTRGAPKLVKRAGREVGNAEVPARLDLGGPVLSSPRHRDPDRDSRGRSRA